MTSSTGIWTQVVGTAAIVFALIGLGGVASRAQAPEAAVTVWSGVYTDDQAKLGEAVANKFCTSCHGPDLSGGEAGPALVGLEFLGNWSTLTLADFFDRVQATMPADAPGTLTAQQTSEAAAYVLKLNKFPAGQAALPTDMAALKKITIVSQQPAQ